MIQDISQKTGPSDNDLELFALRCRPGDPGYPTWLDARAAILERYIGLASHWARRWSRRWGWAGATFADFYDAAKLGMLVAIESFDPARGFPLRLWMFNGIRNEIRREAGTARRLARASLDDAVDLGGPVMGPRRGRFVFSDLVEIVNLDDHDEFSWVLATMARVLTPAERSLLVARYGLDGGERRTLDSLAATLGVSPQAVHRRERGAMARLRAACLAGAFAAA